jgi:hypothetical protein
MAAIREIPDGTDSHHPVEEQDIMNISKIVTAVAATVALAPAAFAATTPAPATTSAAAAAATPAAQCESLQKQFDTAAAANGSNPNLSKAKSAATEGEKLCKNGKPADGAKKLQHALKELGVKAQ